MKIRTEKPEKSKPRERTQMTRNKLKKAALDVFSEKNIDAATAWRTPGC